MYTHSHCVVGDGEPRWLLSHVCMCTHSHCVVGDGEPIKVAAVTCVQIQPPKTLHHLGCFTAFIGLVRKQADTNTACVGTTVHIYVKLGDLSAPGSHHIQLHVLPNMEAFPVQVMQYVRICTYVCKHNGTLLTCAGCNAKQCVLL